VADVTESKLAFLLILKPQNDCLFEILICESLVQEAIDEDHQIQRQSCFSLHQNHRHNVHVSIFAPQRQSLATTLDADVTEICFLLILSADMALDDDFPLVLLL
jgi:hypothetical protein